MYLYLKVIHVTAIIAWMAGVLYHYRLLVNMVDTKDKHPDVHETLYGMATRLYRLILMPAMGVAYLAGIALIAMNPGIMKGGFMHAKLVFVVLLTIVSARGGKMMRNAKDDANTLPSSKKLRLLNEVPTVLMILILIMILVRPF